MLTYCAVEDDPLWLAMGVVDMAMTIWPLLGTGPFEIQRPGTEMPGYLRRKKVVNGMEQSRMLLLLCLCPPEVSPMKLRW